MYHPQQLQGQEIKVLVREGDKWELREATLLPYDAKDDTVATRGTIQREWEDRNDVPGGVTLTFDGAEDVVHLCRTHVNYEIDGSSYRQQFNVGGQLIRQESAVTLPHVIVIQSEADASISIRFYDAGGSGMGEAVVGVGGGGAAGRFRPPARSLKF
jgi:hypothetical protein